MARPKKNAEADTSSSKRGKAPKTIASTQSLSSFVKSICDIMRRSNCASALQYVNFVGHSRYNHQFDFVVPKSRQAPERILRVINNPNKDNAQSAAFAWVDTKDVRPADSLAFAVLNDRDRKVSDAVQDALRSYDITPIAWSKREEFRERLAA